MLERGSKLNRFQSCRLCVAAAWLEVNRPETVINDTTRCWVLFSQMQNPGLYLSPAVHPCLIWKYGVFSHYAVRYLFDAMSHTANKTALKTPIKLNLRYSSAGSKATESFYTYKILMIAWCHLKL